MSLIIKKNTTFKIPRTPFLPSSLGGLALWLKGDAGITTFRNTYASQIILSGGTSSILNKTFVASGTPDPNNYYSYSFGENNGYFITYSQDDTPSYNLRYITDNTGNIIIMNSDDGVNWSLAYNMPNTITISGITGTHSSANRTYNLYSYDGDNGTFYFNASGSDYFISTGDGSGASSTNWFLYKVDPNSPYPFLISTGPLKSSAPSGSWTNNLSSGSPSSTYIGVANGTLPTGSVTTSEYGDFLVTAWADQSGNGNDASANNNPQIISNQLNGKPAIDFDGTKYFISNNQNLNNNSSIFVVVKSRGDHGTLISTSNQQGINFYLGADPNNSIAVGVTNLAGIANDNADNGNNWMIGSTIRSNNLTSIIYKNGTQVATGNYDTAELYPENALIIGTDADLNGYWNINGQMAEIVIYNRALTTPERQQVEAYLNSKYQIY